MQYCWWLMIDQSFSAKKTEKSFSSMSDRSKDKMSSSDLEFLDTPQVWHHYWSHSICRLLWKCPNSILITDKMLTVDKTLGSLFWRKVVPYRLEITVCILCNSLLLVFVHVYVWERDKGGIFNRLILITVLEVDYLTDLFFSLSDCCFKSSFGCLLKLDCESISFLKIVVPNRNFHILWEFCLLKLGCECFFVFFSLKMLLSRMEIFIYEKLVWLSPRKSSWVKVVPKAGGMSAELFLDNALAAAMFYFCGFCFTCTWSW